MSQVFDKAGDKAYKAHWVVSGPQLGLLTNANGDMGTTVEAPFHTTATGMFAKKESGLFNIPLALMGEIWSAMWLLAESSRDGIWSDLMIWDPTYLRSNIKGRRKCLPFSYCSNV